jgi:hypothetical protein
VRVAIVLQLYRSNIMKKLMVEIDYNKHIVCANSKDEQDLIRILGNAKIVSYTYKNNGVLFYTNDSFKMKMVEEADILQSEPEEE